MKKLFYTLLFITAAVCVIINLAANRLIFQPRADYQERLLSDAQEVVFPTAGGIAELHGLYVPPKEYMDTILFFHGNAGNVTYFEDFAAIYAKRGYGVLIFDYRGFGRSIGNITQANVYEDGLAAADYLIKQKKTAPNNIILWGYSFGGAPAINTAVVLNHLPFKALILQSVFTNTPQLAAAIAADGYEPGATLQKFIIGTLHIALFNKTYDNLAKINKVKTPVLIGVSRHDMLIPWQMGQALVAAAPEGAKVFVSPRGRHASFEWFEKEALAFLQ